MWTIKNRLWKNGIYAMVKTKIFVYSIAIKFYWPSPKFYLLLTIDLAISFKHWYWIFCELLLIYFVPSVADHLTSLIKAAYEQNIDFVYAISPGLDITFSSTKDVTLLKKKLEQVGQSASPHQGLWCKTGISSVFTAKIPCSSTLAN